MIELDRNGVYTLTDDEDPTRTLTLPAGTSDDEVKAAIAAFFPPAPLPEVPMYKVRKFLIMQGLLAQVETFLNNLPEPNRSLSLVDWDYAPNFVPTSPLALGAKAILGIDDATYRAFVLAAAELP